MMLRRRLGGRALAATATAFSASSSSHPAVSSWRWCSTTAAETAAPAPEAPAAPSPPKSVNDFTPKQVMEILNKFVIGQDKAKRAVAVALRNRWRRSQLTDEGLKGDVTPKNILMIGPTGVGKTEIARRMARVTDAPFIKVEATKYTEVGFKGKDVESIIEDLFSMSKTKARSRLEKDKTDEAMVQAYDTIYTTLVRISDFAGISMEDFKAKLEAKELDDVMVNVTRTVVQEQKKDNPLASLGLVLVGQEPQAQREVISRPVPDALEVAKQEVLRKLVSDSSVATLAKQLAEEEGIVFVDEIDKVVADVASASADVSSLGVQQDLLPLIEGSTVTLKDGTMINTDTILFICSGAFHVVKPSDMIAELQGRLPVRVELGALTEEDFKRILTEPEYNLVRQQVALMKAEKVDLQFPAETIDAMAEVSATANKNAQNIGARRLHTVIERIMDEPSFNCDEHIGKDLVISPDDVRKATEALVKNVELTKYLL